MDNRRGLGGALGAWIGQLVHDGGIHSRPAGGGGDRRPRPDHSGTPAALSTAAEGIDHAKARPPFRGSSMGRPVEAAFYGFEPTDEVGRAVHNWCAAIFSGTQWEEMAQWHVRIDRRSNHEGIATTTLITLRVLERDIQATATHPEVISSVRNAFLSLAGTLRHESPIRLRPGSDALTDRTVAGR